MPTRRLFAVLLLAAPFGAVGGPLVLLAVAIATLALLAAIVDWLLASDGHKITLERRLASDKLSLADWNPVELRIGNTTLRRQRLQIRDQPPPNFELDLEAPIILRTVAARTDATVSYHVRPPRRGDASFGDLFLRVEGPLGLVRRGLRKKATAQHVRVYPNLRELRRYDLLVRRGLEARPGARAIRVAGASTEFERLREYLPDDEFRRINWKATARRGQPMVNQFESERSQNLVVMLDAGRFMAALADPPPAEPETQTNTALTKLDRALNAGLLLAHVASQRGDRVALLAYTDAVRVFVPPQRGRRALLSTVQALYNLQAEPVEPDHARAFDFLARRNLRRSLVVLFTDLADRESSNMLAAHVLRVARQHLVVCVTLRDPNVRRPALRRPIDSATLYEKMVAQQLLEDRAAVLANFVARGVLTIDSEADALTPRLIAAYLELKQRGRV